MNQDAPRERRSPLASLETVRNVARAVLSDLRSYYLFAAIVVFYLIASRAADMRVPGLLGHVGVLILLLGAILLEHNRRTLKAGRDQCRREKDELQAKVRELEDILASQRIQMETERLVPLVEDIQRKLAAEFPQYTTSFSVAENDGYVYQDELIMTAKDAEGKDLPAEEYTKVLAFARECAKPLNPDLAIHWA